jgi:hypothetical protein
MQRTSWLAQAILDAKHSAALRKIGSLLRFADAARNGAARVSEPDVADFGGEEGVCGDRTGIHNRPKETTMTHRQALDLLAEALPCLNNPPCPCLWLHSNRKRADLASRIETYLNDFAQGESAIAEARERWALSGFIRVDPDETEFDDCDGNYWIRAWVRIGGSTCTWSSVRDRYEEAVAALPLFTREIFNAHRIDGLKYSAIAERFGIAVAEVEDLIAEALLGVSRMFHPKK